VTVLPCAGDQLSLHSLPLVSTALLRIDKRDLVRSPLLGSRCRKSRKKNHGWMAEWCYMFRQTSLREKTFRPKLSPKGGLGAIPGNRTLAPPPPPPSAAIGAGHRVKSVRCQWRPYPYLRTWRGGAGISSVGRGAPGWRWRLSPTAWSLFSRSSSIAAFTRYRRSSLLGPR
jgi:hypothetical protein